MSLPLVLIVVVFVLGYALIVLEHNLGIDKAASAVLTGVLCWTVYALASAQIVDVGQLPADFLAEHPGRGAAWLAHTWVVEHELMRGFGDIASILFFLLGAMTIVETVDAYGGFAIVTDRIRSRSMVSLLWSIGFVTFFLSSVLDNLTTTIVMISLIRKLVADQDDRWWLAGLVVVAANAGGAWSPIGDVTTTMLWIGGQITTGGIMLTSFLPSLLCMMVPLAWLSWRMRGKAVTPPEAGTSGANGHGVSPGLRTVIFALGMGGLLFVPVFKSATHLPPFMGMLLSLGVLWVATELFGDREHGTAKLQSINDVLKKVDTPSVLFFLGILLAVSALESTGVLRGAAQVLDARVGNLDAIVFLIGLASAVVDNVPIVAGAMGMYDHVIFPQDAFLWKFMAYAAGTGGSCLIIGSAAGVAAMSLEKIRFGWYLRTIGPLALAGYASGAALMVFAIAR